MTRHPSRHYQMKWVGVLCNREAKGDRQPPSSPLELASLAAAPVDEATELAKPAAIWRDATHASVCSRKEAYRMDFRAAPANDNDLRYVNRGTFDRRRADLPHRRGHRPALDVPMADTGRLMT